MIEAHGEAQEQSEQFYGEFSEYEIKFALGGAQPFHFLGFSRDPRLSIKFLSGSAPIFPEKWVSKERSRSGEYFILKVEHVHHSSSPSKIQSKNFSLACLVPPVGLALKFFKMFKMTPKFQIVFKVV
jgi:hypothetical protein